MEQWDSGHMCSPTIVTGGLSWIANMLSTLTSTLSLHKSGQDLPDLLRLAWPDLGHTPMTSHPGLLWIAARVPFSFSPVHRSPSTGKAEKGRKGSQGPHC